MSRIGPRAHDEHRVVASCGRSDGWDRDETVWLGVFKACTDLKDQRHWVASGQLILAGPTLGPVNTGLVIFDAPDEQAARQVMQEDPVVRGGYARGEVRPFRVSLLRGRTEADD